MALHIAAAGHPVYRRALLRAIEAARNDRPVCANRLHMWCYTVLVLYVAIREEMGFPIPLDTNGFLDFQDLSNQDMDPEHSNFPHQYLLPGNGRSMEDLWDGAMRHTVFSRINPTLSVTAIRSAGFVEYSQAISDAWKTILIQSGGEDYW